VKLIDGWNALGPGIVAVGNGARREPPAQDALSGWKRAAKNADQAPHFQDIPALLAAIRGAKFCHRKGWFSLCWLFGKNKNHEFNIARLMAGAYNEESRDGHKHNGHAIGRGQRNEADAAARSEPGTF
jgi:hypothetical protein